MPMRSELGFRLRQTHTLNKVYFQSFQFLVCKMSVITYPPPPPHDPHPPHHHHHHHG